MWNIPEAVYHLSDPALSRLVYLLVPKEDIRRRLADEQRIFDKSYIDYALDMLGIIHERAGSMVSHLSLMLALCMFLLQSNEVMANLFHKWVLLADTFAYLILVILSVRCLRSFGLDKDRADLSAYEAHMEEELTLKFSIMQIVNSFTICATVILVILIAIIYAA